MEAGRELDAQVAERVNEHIAYRFRVLAELTVYTPEDGVSADPFTATEVALMMDPETFRDETRAIEIMRLALDALRKKMKP